MIRKKTLPTTEEGKQLYGDYIGWCRLLLWVSYAGSFYSGMTEWSGLQNDALAKDFPVLYPFITIALIEVVREVVASLFLSISRMIKNFDAKRIPVIILQLGLTILLICASFYKSSDGIINKADEKYVSDSTYTVDSSRYSMLCQTCNNKWHSDSLAIVPKVKSEHGTDLEKQQRAKRAANQRISKLKDKEAEWAIKTVVAMTNKAQVALGNIRNLNRKIDDAITDSLRLAKSEYKSCLAAAQDTLLHYTRLAENQHQVVVAGVDDKKNRKKWINHLLLYLALSSIVIHAAFRQWLYHVSGVEVTYTFFKSEDNKVGFGQKFIALFGATLHNWSDTVLSWFWSDMTVELKNGEVNIVKENDTKKNQEREQKRIEDEKKRLAEEAALAKQKADLEALKIATELQRTKFKAEQEKLEDERKKAKIKAESERKTLAASTLAEQKRLKEVAEENLRIEKEKIRREAAQRVKQQEKIRLRKEQQEIAEHEQQEKDRQQEIATRKALAEKAALLAAKKEENDRIEQQEKAKLQQAKATLNRKKTTGNIPQTSDDQELVDDMFAKNTVDGKLKICKDFNQATRNYYNRWQKATEKLRGDLSEGRRQQAIQARDDNKAKFEYTVDKAENLGISIKVDSTGKVIIKYIK